MDADDVVAAKVDPAIVGAEGEAVVAAATH
jgi:hypothetical protein